MIRTAKKSDYKQLMALYDIFMKTKRYYKADYDSFTQVLADKKAFIFVAEEKHKLAGFITFRLRHVVRYPQLIGQVEELFVLKQFRKHGIGKKLMKQTEKIAKKFKCKRIYVESRYNLGPAHKFYKALGYRKSGFYFLKK